MSSVNKVLLIGNLGQDPELRSTAGGTAVCNLRIATTDRRKDKDGNWSEFTEWHTIVAFGRTAENASQYLKKGRQIWVEGRLQTRKWKDRNGQDRYSTEVVAENIIFLGGQPAAGGASAGGGGPRRQAPAYDQGDSYSSRGGGADPGPMEEPPPYDDDVPF